MPYVQLDDQIAQHPKVLRAGPEAAWLWACAIAYANRQLTDGVVPVEALSTMGAFRTQVTKVADRLVAVGLFERVEGGYAVHDYLEHNPDRDTVKARMAQAAARKAAYRARQSGPDRPPPQPRRDSNVPQGQTRPETQDGRGMDSGTHASSRAHVPTPTPTPTKRDDDYEREVVGDHDRPRPAEAVASSSSQPEPSARYRMAAQEAHALWVAALPDAEPRDWATLQPPGRRKIADFVRDCGSLDRVEAFVRRVAASDYLAGRKDLPAVNLFTAIERFDKVMAGAYDNRTDGQEAIYASVMGGTA